MKKRFFHVGENVETSFFSPKTTRYVYKEYAPTFNSRGTNHSETFAEVSGVAHGSGSFITTLHDTESATLFF